MTTLRILCVEDNPDDAELLILTLQRAGYHTEWLRVWDRSSMLAALREQVWDVILCDYHLPSFDALAALDVIHAVQLDLPFIIVSGTIDDVAAVQAMRAGAHDYFTKQGLTRLPAAVARECTEARLRSERRRAIAALREAEIRSKLILEHTPDTAILMLDPVGKIASWNDGAARVFGIPPEDALGSALAPILPEDMPEARPDAPVFGDGCCTSRNGRDFWAEVSIHPIHENHSFIGWSVVVRDVSDRKRLLDELRRAVQARDDFLSIASHELKTPLTTMTLQVQMALRAMRSVAADDEDDAASALHKRLQRVEQHAQRMRLLIDRLLDITQIHSGQLALSRDALDLTSSVRSAVERVRDQVGEAGVPIRFESAAPIIGQWDAFRIDTIVTNLLDNALKYGNKKPIAVEVGRQGDCAAIRVIDQGQGVQEADRERIFQRFERGVSRHDCSGFGIGLWMVRQLAQAHGGDARVETSQDGGSIFTVELPLQ